MPRSTPVAGGARDAFPRLLLGALASLCDGALVITLLFLVVVTGAGVVSRYLEGSPFAWTDEVAGYLFVALTFFGAASGFARRR